MKLFFNIFKSSLAFLYMTISIIAGVLLLMDIENKGELLIKKLNIQSSEKSTGGNISKEIEYDTYISRIHTPVFEGIINYRKRGFVQIGWFSNNTLPQFIEENIDYNNDGIDDIKINLDTEKNKVIMTKYNNNVINIMDKTSMGVLIMRGHNDSSYGVFSYENYEEPIFLGYTIQEVRTIDFIKKMITKDDQILFENYLRNITSGKAIESIELSMIHKVKNQHEKVRITNEFYSNDEQDKYRILFNTNDKNVKQQMMLIINKDDINKNIRVYPKTYYKEAKIIRVLLKNDKLNL